MESARRWTLFLGLAVAMAAALAACDSGDESGEGGATDVVKVDDIPTPPDDTASMPEDTAAEPDLDATPVDDGASDAVPDTAVAEDTAAADADVGPTGPQQLTMGPALFHVRTDRVTVLFETEYPGAGRIELLDGDTVAQTVETHGSQPDNSWYIFPTIDFEFYMHRGELTGLAPATRYTYRVAAGEAEEGPFEFVTAPRGGEGSFRFGIFGDNRTNHDDHRRVSELLSDRSPDLLLNTGDLVNVGVNQADWHTFFAIEHDLLATTPSWMTIGNHESLLGTPHSARYYALDTAAPFNGFVMRVDYGPMRLLVLNSQIPTHEGEQVEWVREELAAADADPKVRYLFVTLHQPFYTFSNHEPDLDGREVLGPLFLEHGVQAVFTGHNHVYERFLVDGIHHVVTGGGGAPQYGIDSNVVEEEVPLRVEARQALHAIIGDIDEERATFTVVNADTEEVIETFEVLAR